MFESKDDIKKYVEDGESGITVTWAKKLGNIIITILFYK